METPASLEAPCPRPSSDPVAAIMGPSLPENQEVAIYLGLRRTGRRRTKEGSKGNQWNLDSTSGIFGTEN